jgi:hypothetical protein
MAQEAETLVLVESVKYIVFSTHEFREGRGAYEHLHSWIWLRLARFHQWSGLNLQFQLICETYLCYPHLPHHIGSLVMFLLHNATTDATDKIQCCLGEACLPWSVIHRIIRRKRNQWQWICQFYLSGYFQSWVILKFLFVLKACDTLVHVCVFFFFWMVQFNLWVWKGIYLVR